MIDNDSDSGTFFQTIDDSTPEPVLIECHEVVQYCHKNDEE
jgi:hypothetical protein